MILNSIMFSDEYEARKGRNRRGRIARRRKGQERYQMEYLSLYNTADLEDSDVPSRNLVNDIMLEHIWSIYKPDTAVKYSGESPIF